MIQASQQEIQKVICDYLSQDQSRRHLHEEEIKREIVLRLNKESLSCDTDALKLAMDKALEKHYGSKLLGIVSIPYLVFELLTLFQILDWAPYITGVLRVTMVIVFILSAFKLHFKKFENSDECSQGRAHNSPTRSESKYE